MNPKEIAKLNQAARAGDLGVIKKLLAKASAPPDQKQLDDALYSAVSGQQAEAVSLLLTAGAEPGRAGGSYSLLMVAAMNGDLEIARRLVEAGADVHHQIGRETALSAALSENQTALIAYLDSLGAAAPAATMLYHASASGNLPWVERALAEGGRPEAARDEFGDPALEAAARGGHLETVACLLKHGAKPGTKTNGSTALTETVQHGDKLAMIELLLDAGAKVNEHEYGKTVLMMAAARGWLEAFNLLLARGADPDASEKEVGMSVLDHAKLGKNKEILAILQQRGVASPRDAIRVLTEQVVRELGGKPVEVMDGFMVGVQLGGLPCRLHLRRADGSAILSGVKFTDPGLKRAGEAALLISVGKPENPRRSWEAARAISQALDRDVYHSIGNAGLPEGVLNEFCARHQERLRKLVRVKKESLEIGDATIYFSWEGADATDIVTRVRILGELVQAIAKPPQPGRQLFTGEWLLKPVTRGNSRALAIHQGGGIWEHSVACPECGRATNPMAVIDLRDPTLPENPLGRERLPVFWCLTCLEWDPAFYELDAPEQKSAHAGSKATTAKLETGEPDLPMTCLALTPQPAGKKTSSKSKLGGKPVWLQEDETPDCPKCRKAMAFALQLASGNQVTFGDMGTLYAFVCEKCRVTASLIQSH